MSSIFDKDRYEHRSALQDLQMNDKGGAAMGQAKKAILPSQISQKGQSGIASSKTPQSQENFKIQLKCMRIWKIFAK